MSVRTRVGIVGYGMVGQAVGAWFTRAAKYSPRQFPDGWPAVNACDIVFVCVPSPYSRRTGFDLSAIHQTARTLTGRKIVVLKSTVLPGTTAKLQKKYPQHTWLFNPEFLVEKTHIQDFLKPDRQILGLAKKTVRHRRAARRVMRLLPAAPFRAVTTSTEAELIKIGANTFGALKVVYANMMYDLARQVGADYETVRAGIVNDARIGPSWTRIWFDGYRGYSGKCFPKDVGALIAFGRTTKRRFRFLEAADAYNWKLLPAKRRQR